MNKIINRILTKPGYKIIALAILFYAAVSYWNTIAVTAYVDSDGYVYATQIGDSELRYINEIKLTNSNIVNFDYIKQDRN